jgi:hypothetical protein
MFWKKHEEKSFVGVALAMILGGAGILSFGVIGWLMNVSQGDVLVAFPSLKVIGGLVVISLGYIQLELELLRRKQ